SVSSRSTWSGRHSIGVPGVGQLWPPCDWSRYAASGSPILRPHFFLGFLPVSAAGLADALPDPPDPDSAEPDPLEPDPVEPGAPPAAGLSPPLSFFADSW